MNLNDLIKRAAWQERRTVIDLSKSEERQFPSQLYQSILNLSNHQPATGLIREIDEATRASEPERSWGAQSIAFPLDLLEKRALFTNTFSSGGAFVGAGYGAQPFGIEPMLRAASVCIRAGAERVTGLTHNLSIPRETGFTTVQWLHEAATVTQSDSTTGELNLTPHRCSGSTSLSRQLQAQSGDVAVTFLLDSLARGIAAGWDAGALNGAAAAGEVSGIYKTQGISTVTFGGSATLAKAASFESAIAQANGTDEDIVFVAKAETREKWKTIQRWSGASVALWTDDERVLGKRAFVTQAMPANGILAGQFARNMILAMWGNAVGLTVNPYSDSSRNYALEGKIGLTVDFLGDVGSLRPQLYAVNADSAVQ